MAAGGPPRAAAPLRPARGPDRPSGTRGVRQRPLPARRGAGREPRLAPRARRGSVAHARSVRRERAARVEWGARLPL